jgi:CTP-dependent riboflavin kinase
MIIKGKIVSGMGKARKFIPKYNEDFQKKLGFIAYPGTINMQVEEVPELLQAINIIIADGGKVDCYPIIINKIHKGAIVKPNQTEHSARIMEIIAPEKLDIGLGDEITCELV